MSKEGRSRSFIKISAVVSCAMLSKETAAYPAKVQSTVATRYGMFDFFLVDSMVYIRTVNNSNNT